MSDKEIHDLFNRLHKALDERTHPNIDTRMSILKLSNKVDDLHHEFMDIVEASMHR